MVCEAPKLTSGRALWIWVFTRWLHLNGDVDPGILKACPDPTPGSDRARRVAVNAHGVQCGKILIALAG